MEIEKIKIDLLKPYDGNAKKHPKEQIEQIKNSIVAFGMNDPIGIDENNTIIEGHGRLIALKELKFTEVECIRLTHMSPDDKKAYILAHNKTTMNTGFDTDILAGQMGYLLSIDYDIHLTAFDPAEIDELFKDDINGNIKEDGFNEPLPENPISRGGDLWLLGRHRLICGDSTNPETYSALMDGKKANLVVTDPPYNVAYEGTAGTIKNDNMEDAAFYNFLFSAFGCMSENAKTGCPIYVFHADTEGVNFRKAFKQAGFKLAECLVWVKNSLVLGRQDYHWRHEPILYGWKEGSAHKWYGQRDKTTVIEDEIELHKLKKEELVELAQKLIESIPDSIIYFDKPSRNSLHPTMKPIGLIARLITNSSLTNSIVLDPFSGSFSTGIACEQTNRICYGIELDPKYVDVCISRFLETCGNADSIQLIRGGKTLTFNDVKNLDGGEKWVKW